MGLMDAVFGHADDYITIFFVIFLVIAAMYFAGFNVSQAFASFQNITKYIVGAAAAASGVFIIYKSERTRSPIDDTMGAVLGLSLIAMGGAIAFGGSIMSYVSQAAETVKSIIPLAVGGAIAFVGAKIAQGRDKTSEILGIIMIVLGLALLGFKITGLIG